MLIVVADDLGTDKIASYGEHPRTPRTPRIDALAAEGVRFRNAYVYPLCSATRAALLTGRYGRRNGMGAIVDWRTRWELPLAERTIPEALAPTYTSEAVGKWHLSGPDTPSGARHPNLQGFAHFSGSLQNLNSEHGADTDYFHWDEVTDGEVRRVDEYATRVTTDRALAAIRRMPEPWFLYVGYNAPHVPVHMPPGRDPGRRPVKGEKHEAMVEDLDREFGRLLDGLAPAVRARTVIMFLGDNGTEPQAILPPRNPEEGKTSLFEGGTNVPLVVSAPNVGRPGEWSDALVHVVDILPTVAELAGIELGGPTIDGVSFAPVLANPSSAGARRFVYTERFNRTGPPPWIDDVRAVRDERFKLLVDNGKTQLYDLRGRHDDGPALRMDDLPPEERKRARALKAELERLERELVFEY